MHQTIQTHPDDDRITPEPPRSPWRWAKWAALAVVGAVALLYGAIFFYANVLNDAPDEFDGGDLSAALTDETETPTGDQVADAVDDNGAAAPADPATADPATPDPATPDPATPDPATPDPATPDGDVAATPTAAGSIGDDPPAASPAGFDGTWIPTEASEFGYRVEEVLAGVNTTAVGRGSDITGELVIEDTTVTALEVVVDVATITSDDSRRDGQFRGRIMETEQFPTATFALTEPIELGALPAEGEQVTATATGDLTLHGVTRQVTFEVTAEATAGRIGVLGSIPVLFADYDIDNPSFSGVKTEDDGLLEFVLVFERP